MAFDLQQNLPYQQPKLMSVFGEHLGPIRTWGWLHRNRKAKKEWSMSQFHLPVGYRIQIIYNW